MRKVTAEMHAVDDRDDVQPPWPPPFAVTIGMVTKFTTRVVTSAKKVRMTVRETRILELLVITESSV